MDNILLGDVFQIALAARRICPPIEPLLGIMDFLMSR